MQKNESDVLDQFEEEEEKRWYHHALIVYGPIALFSIGLIFRAQHWPGARLIITLAMALLVARSFIYFFTSRRKWFEWIYFSSRIVLLIALMFTFGWNVDNKPILIPALIYFAFGVLIYFIKTRNQKPEKHEKEEDDY
jgi:hypothetical protein